MTLKDLIMSINENEDFSKIDFILNYFPLYKYA